MHSNMSMLASCIKVCSDQQRSKFSPHFRGYDCWIICALCVDSSKTANESTVQMLAVSLLETEVCVCVCVCVCVA